MTGQYIIVIYLCILLFNTFYMYKLFNRDAREFGTTTWTEIKKTFKGFPLSNSLAIFLIILIPFASLLIYNKDEP